MSERVETAPPESKAGGLWILAASPSVWAAHFLLSYGTAAVWCARYAEPGAPLGPARVAIAVYTAAALALIGGIGVHAFRRQRPGEDPHDDDTPEDRHRFLGFATLLLSGLSAVAVLYASLAAVFIGDCW